MNYKDFRKLDLTEVNNQEKITIIKQSDFGYPITIQLKLDEVILKKYAQYDNCLYIVGTPKRKRKKMGYLIKPYEDFKIFKGWVELNQTAKVQNENGVTITSLGRCFDSNTFQKASDIDAVELIAS